MPEKKEPSMFEALNDYMEVVYTARFLKDKYIPALEDMVLMGWEADNKELGYVGIEFLKCVVKNLEDGLQEGKDQVTFDQIIAKNFKDKEEN